MGIITQTPQNFNSFVRACIENDAEVNQGLFQQSNTENPFNKA